MIDDIARRLIWRFTRIKFDVRLNVQPSDRTCCCTLGLLYWQRVFGDPESPIGVVATMLPDDLHEQDFYSPSSAAVSPLETEEET